MQNKRFRELFHQYLTNNISYTDRQELLNLIHTGLYDQELETIADDHFGNINDNIEQISIIDEDKVFKEILGINSVLPKVKFYQNKYFQYAAAACVLFLLTFGFNALYNNYQRVQFELAASKILPASEKAQIILSNGKIINLDSLTLGSTAIHNGIAISKAEDGALVYEMLANAAEIKGENIIKIPRGGKYKVHLADGSMVWLNAASSLKFPNKFTGNKREVRLEGEGYFEIAKNTKQPFVVYAGNQFVEVLGTQFNLSAYNDDEYHAITLIEGSVKTGHKNSSLLLNPGQQVVYRNTFDKQQISSADIEKVLAWKNEEFIFKDETLAEVMREVARWYDVEIEYGQNVDPNKILIGGWVSRNKNITAITKIIESVTKLTVKVEGRRLIVTH